MKLKSSQQREIALILFVVSIFGILALTLWPPYIWEDTSGMWGHLRILIERPTWHSGLSLVPFTVFKDYLEDLFKGPVFFIVTLINFFWEFSNIHPYWLIPCAVVPRCHLEKVCNHWLWNVLIYWNNAVFYHAKHCCWRYNFEYCWGNVRLPYLPVYPKAFSKVLRWILVPWAVNKGLHNLLWIVGALKIWLKTESSLSYPYFYVLWWF